MEDFVKKVSAKDIYTVLSAFYPEKISKDVHTVNDNSDLSSLKTGLIADANLRAVKFIFNGNVYILYKNHHQICKIISFSNDHTTALGPEIIGSEIIGSEIRIFTENHQDDKKDESIFRAAYTEILLKAGWDIADVQNFKPERKKQIISDMRKIAYEAMLPRYTSSSFETPIANITTLDLCTRDNFMDNIKIKEKNFADDLEKKKNNAYAKEAILSKIDNIATKIFKTFNEVEIDFDNLHIICLANGAYLASDKESISDSNKFGDLAFEKFGIGTLNQFSDEDIKWHQRAFEVVEKKFEALQKELKDEKNNLIDDIRSIAHSIYNKIQYNSKQIDITIPIDHNWSLVFKNEGLYVVPPTEVFQKTFSQECEIERMFFGNNPDDALGDFKFHNLIMEMLKKKWDDLTNKENEKNDLVTHINQTARELYKEAKKNVIIDLNGECSILCTDKGAYFVRKENLNENPQDCDGFGKFSFGTEGRFSNIDLEDHDSIKSILESKLKELKSINTNAEQLNKVKDELKKILQNIYVEKEKNQSTLESEFNDLVTNKDINSVKKKVIEKTQELEKIKKDKAEALALKKRDELEKKQKNNSANNTKTVATNTQDGSNSKPKIITFDKINFFYQLLSIVLVVPFIIFALLGRLKDKSQIKDKNIPIARCKEDRLTFNPEGEVKKREQLMSLDTSNKNSDVSRVGIL